MEQQNQQLTQEQTTSKPVLKANWKFLIMLLVLGLLVTTGMLIWRERARQHTVSLQETVSSVRPTPLTCTPAISFQERVEQLSKAKSILELEVSEGEFALSPDGRYLAAKKGKEGSTNRGFIQIYDLFQYPSTSIEVPNRGQISAVFSSDGKSVWFGTKTGNAVQVNLQTKKVEKSIPILNGRVLDEIAISDDGRYLGWHSPPMQILFAWPPPPEYKGSSAGVFDIMTGRQLKVWENADYRGVGPGTPTKNISFGSQSSRFLTYTREGLVAWNASTDVTQTILGIYPMYNSFGYVYIDGKVYYSSGDDIL